MIFGFFPPSSSESFLKTGAAVAAMADPVLVPPVNEIAFISLCSTIACPAFGPKPCTIFKTPAGNPASMQIFESMKAVMGVISDGFATTQFPAARAGAIFHENKYSGKFQGEMQPTTPIG